MSCINGCKPTSKIKKESLANAIVLVNHSDWNDDNGHDNSRYSSWIIYADGTKVYQSEFEILSAPLSITSGSTHKELVLPNGAKDVIDFLNNEGINTSISAQIGIAIIVKNTKCNTSNESEICELTVLDNPCIGCTTPVINITQPDSIYPVPSIIPFTTEVQWGFDWNLRGDPVNVISDILIDWGDGSSDIILNGVTAAGLLLSNAPPHQYANYGAYLITVSFEINGYKNILKGVFDYKENTHAAYFIVARNAAINGTCPDFTSRSQTSFTRTFSSGYNQSNNQLTNPTVLTNGTSFIDFTNAPYGDIQELKAMQAVTIDGNTFEVSHNTEYSWNCIA